MSFQTPIDIADRALDHCGQDPLDPALGFTESSKKARLCARIYDKLRLAELQRNTWTFATKRVILRPIDTNTMLLAPALWVASTTYFVGSLVADETGQIWESVLQDNLGNQPENSLAWAEYCGPLAVSLYDSTTSYSASELVYTTAGDGTNRVFRSLQNGNSDNPATATAWSVTAVYAKDQVVTYLSIAYMSRIDLNIAHVPPQTPANWNALTSYNLGDTVTGSDGIMYSALGTGNTGFNPTTDFGVHWLSLGLSAPWTPTFTGGRGSLKWVQIGGAEFPMGVGLRTLNIIYPLGAGPSSQSSSANAFLLPSGFLRKAPTDPKAGSVSFLGAPSNAAYEDWLFESGFLISRESGPIMLRFIADIVDVTAMNPMFCEGLAARMGLAMCEPLTQSSEKLKTIASEYEKFMGDARLSNAIETGSVEPPLDDWIACRA